MRHGYTTGSCSAAAAKAAAYMLLTGREKNSISITTPSGLIYDAEIVNINLNSDYCECAVIKDGGDDPDVTTGAHVTAHVSVTGGGSEGPLTITVDGGKGVGRVTKPGLDQKIGSAAINHVPREMIESEVREVFKLFDVSGEVKVVISVPEGEALAAKTFNPRLGIEDGISILGTSGIVEPMSSKAILDTIDVELNQLRALGFTRVVVSPGNYGMDYMKNTFDYDLDKAVKCSNFIGDTINMAAGKGFKEFLLVGHIGKLVKISGGIMNTHSKYADCRMELIAAAAIKCGVSQDKLSAILDCISTEEAVRILNTEAKTDEVMGVIMERISHNLKKPAGSMKIECIMYSSEFGTLGASDNALSWIKEKVE